jgi:uracil-DNA glycosylase family 4
MATHEDIDKQLREHFRFYAELGVEGVSRDAEWRDRFEEPTPVPPPAVDPVSAHETVGGPEPAAMPETPDAVSVPADRAVMASRPVIRVESLDDIAREIGPDCSRCKLHALGRSHVVFGVGNPDADLMFIGEAPGFDEDVQGIPFVGRAGQLLTKIIEAIQLRREDVYIANVIKCRPPENRNPEPDEVETCEPFLLRQVQVVKPRVIVALGAFAAKALLRSKDPISRLRGHVYPYGDARLVPTFHPAYVLRNPSSKRDVWEDMKKVRALLIGDAGERG